MITLPHKLPAAARDRDAEVIAWACDACGELVWESGARTACSVDWRGRIVPGGLDELKKLVGLVADMERAL